MRFLFDKRDHELLRIVNEIVSREQSFNYAKKLFYPYFHTRGIKEMAESKGLRIAYAVAHLLDTLEVGKVDERLTALRTLRNEVLNTTDSPLRINTARVLVQIMKELVRSHGDYRKQLELAHDFRTAASGKPRIVRRELKKYHLLEMPEENNQVTFDDHVHDANTKGRKSSTHVIMDAWIKGIKRLRVIHYNYIQPKFAAELMEAAGIMGITVRIGIEFSAHFYDKYINIIWVPRGFPDSQSFLCFLAEPSVISFMEEGRNVSIYRQRYVLLLLKEFNERHRMDINNRFGIEMPILEESKFLAFVGVGQASLVHLGKFIHMNLLPVMQAKVTALQERYHLSETEEQLDIERLINDMNVIDHESIVKDYLKPEHNPNIHDPNVPYDSEDVPQLLRLNPKQLVHKLTQLRSGYRITLNLTDINIEDAIEILYDCEGEITRLEIFNLKDYAAGKTDNIPPIAELQHAINTKNVITLKRIIRATIEKVENSELSNQIERTEKLRAILHDISTLRSFYNGTALISRIGSDSTGRSPRVHGMGLAIMETLPQKAQKEIRRNVGPKRLIIPIVINVHFRKTYIPKEIRYQWLKPAIKRLRNIRFFQRMTHHYIKDWEVDEYSTRMKPVGNIVTLGGVHENVDNQFTLNKTTKKIVPQKISWKYLNTFLKNSLKVLIGFIPAFLTFFLTKDWWVLAYCGAFIWFGITGFRNIVQSVLGGGGLSRSPLLRWNDFVSWDRLTDSLMYTGFSVPLLDYLVKTIILDNTMGITTTTPYALYTFMALANGIYLSAHNAFRGLQKVAIYGNFFRSILSIPIAIGLNSFVGELMLLSGVININDILQKWAAIISKAASDCVAGIIEGTADRYQNIKMRERDYNDKLHQLFNAYSDLELLFPDTAVFELLESSQKLLKTSSSEVRDLETIFTINALDQLYFWMYQPRSHSAFHKLLRNLSEEERQILIRCQFVLQRTRKISYLFVDGIIGENFSKALSFYLDRSKEYLEVLEKLR